MFHLGIIFLITYLVGSINFGLILGYIQGLDLRSQGSGNAGATNALRILGTRSGIFVFIGDALKGYLALYFCNLTYLLWKTVSPWVVALPRVDHNTQA